MLYFEYLYTLKVKPLVTLVKTGPEVIKHFSYSTQLSMKFQMLISIKKYQEIELSLGPDKLRMLFFLLINVKMPTTVGILTNWHFNIYEKENFYAQLSLA